MARRAARRRLVVLLLASGCARDVARSDTGPLRVEIGRSDASSVVQDEPVAAPDAAVAATQEPRVPKNHLDIATYPAEQRVSGDATIIVAARVRAAPRAGSVVATLSAGTRVTKVATHDGCVRVWWSDPTTPDDVLEGWVPADALKD